MENPKRIIYPVLVLACVVAVVIGVRSGVLLLPGMDINKDASKPSLEGQITYGPIFSEPNQYRRELLKEAWMRRIPIGKSTFGNLLLQQARFSIDGSGPAVGRSVRASTPPAAQLLSGRSQERTEAFIHGFQRLLDDREGYAKGLSLSRSKDGFAANWLVIFVDTGFFDAYTRSLSDQRQLVKALLDYSKDLGDTWAWFQFDSSWIVLGPEMSLPLEKALRNPQKVSPKQQLQIAYILRHEIEHSVSAYDIGYEDYGRMLQIKWMEEGSADTLARWPGVAASTAKELGLRYPRRAERLAYDRIYKDASGYNDWVFSIRSLVKLAGINVNDPKAFDEVDSLLQGGPLDQLPSRMASAIVTEQGLRRGNRAWLLRQIRALDGEPAKARKLTRDVRRRAQR